MKNQGSERMNFALVPQLEKMTELYVNADISDSTSSFTYMNGVVLQDWYLGLLTMMERKKTWNQNSN